MLSKNSARPRKRCGTCEYAGFVDPASGIQATLICRFGQHLQPLQDEIDRLFAGGRSRLAVRGNYKCRRFCPGSPRNKTPGFDDFRDEAEAYDDLLRIQNGEMKGTEYVG